MATIRERKKRDGVRAFHVQVRMSGFPARTASFPTKRQAERWATTVEAEMIDGRHFRNAEARRRTLGDAVDRYFEYEIKRKRDPRMHRTTLSWWKKELGHVKLASLTSALIMEKRDQLASGTYQRSRPEQPRSKFGQAEASKFPRSGATVNRYLSCLGHLLTVARREWQWIGVNPMDGVSKLPEGPGRVRSLSDSERKILFAQTKRDPTLHAFVVVALSTACRAGELLELKWSDVDLRSGRLLFRNTKNATPRTGWLLGEGLELLKEHAKVRRLGSDRVFGNTSGRGVFAYHRPFRAAVAAAGIANFRFHDLRHSAATYLAQAGATEQQLRAIGGWKSNVVSRYVHLAAEDAKTALEKLAGKVMI